MNEREVDVIIVGAGPVGLLCAYLGSLWGLDIIVVDKSKGPLEVGRADALNARTLQLLATANLFDRIYPLGRACNTSSVWADGKFVSRESSWWEELEGCSHKHFLMLGQARVEKVLDDYLKEIDNSVWRSTKVENIEIDENGCVTTLGDGVRIRSRYVIGADGSRSYVRAKFQVPFAIVRPEMTWAVIDGVVDTDFEKVPEIIVFQSETSDVAWIPREGAIDRFYVRMDTFDFTLEDALLKINRAMFPHVLRFTDIEWYSRFSVKEAVAERFKVSERVFLAGDACHIHSVNGGQGLNTGIGDAFNLMWKIGMVVKRGYNWRLLDSYELERKPVAQSVIDSSGELVRSTKYSAHGTHARDYVNIVRQRAGNITGMGIRYSVEGLVGTRIFDFEVASEHGAIKMYSLLSYKLFTLLIFRDSPQTILPRFPEYIKVIQIGMSNGRTALWSNQTYYREQAILVRPDSYIQAACSLEDVDIQATLRQCCAQFL